MANKGMLTPLSDLSNFNFEEEKWSKAMCRESTFNNKIYGMGQPQFRELLLYNKKMFQKNGWDDLYELQSQGKLDWTALFNIMSKAAKTDAAGNVTQYGLVPTYDIGEFGYSMIHANGINAVTHKYNTKTMNYTLDSAAARTALSTLKTWVDQKRRRLRYQQLRLGHRALGVLLGQGRHGAGRLRYVRADYCGRGL